MQWFRLYAEFATDPKVQVLSEAMQRRLIMLFCLQCENDLSNFTDEHIKYALGISKKELEKTKILFQKCKFIDANWKIFKWKERQFQSDSSKIRTKRYRDSSKNAASSDNVTVKDRHSDGDVTPQIQIQIQRTDTDTEHIPPNPPKGDVNVINKKTELINHLDLKFPNFAYSMISNHKVMMLLNDFVREGVTTEDIDNHIRWMIQENEGGKPVTYYRSHIIAQARHRRDPINTPPPRMAAGQEEVVTRERIRRETEEYEKELQRRGKVIDES